MHRFYYKNFLVKHTPLLMASAAPAHSVGDPSISALAERGGRGLRHEAESPQGADAVSEATPTPRDAAPRPPGAAGGALDRPGDCAAAPTRPTRGPRQSSRAVGARPPPITSGAVPPSARELFFPQRSFRGHSTQCASMVISIWWCQPGDVRTASWSIPRSVLPSAPHGSMAQRRPLHHTKGRQGVLTGACLME
jgi:hypothetical protein